MLQPTENFQHLDKNLVWKLKTQFHLLHDGKLQYMKIRNKTHEPVLCN